MKSLRQELLNAGIASNELVQALFTQLYIGMIRLVSMPSQNVQQRKQSLTIRIRVTIK